MLDQTELTTHATLALLARYRLEVVLAVRPWTLDGLPETLRALAASEIPVTLWPMIADREGRWASVYNAQAFAPFVPELRACVAAAGLGAYPVLYDLEPPIDVVARIGEWAAAGGPARSVRALVTLASLAPGPRGCALETSMRLLADDGVEVLSAVAPMVLFDSPRGRRRQVFSRLLGMPEVDACRTITVMAYTSMIEGWSRRSLRREDAVSVLSFLASRARTRWGLRAGLSLGTVGPGALRDEPCYRSPDELAVDVAVAASAGVTDLALFELRGVLEREPERWLGPFTAPHAPVRVALTPRVRALVGLLSPLSRA